MHKGSENNLMDNLFLCIKRKEHYDPDGGRNQTAEKLDPKKELVAPKELLLPESFSRRHSSTFSIKGALSVIKNYWKK
jgi:hypothetical protein